MDGPAEMDAMGGRICRDHVCSRPDFLCRVKFWNTCGHKCAIDEYNRVYVHDNSC
jgi:hypothetical protein